MFFCAVEFRHFTRALDEEGNTDAALEIYMKLLKSDHILPWFVTLFLCHIISRYNISHVRRFREHILTYMRNFLDLSLDKEISYRMTKTQLMEMLNFIEMSDLKIRDSSTVVGLLGKFRDCILCVR